MFLLGLLFIWWYCVDQRTQNRSIYQPPRPIFSLYRKSQSAFFYEIIYALTSNLPAKWDPCKEVASVKGKVNILLYMLGLDASLFSA